MALTSKGFRTGRAGASDLEDTREMIRNAQDEERQRVVNEKYLNEERELLGAMDDKHGEKFWNWYYSPEVPDGGRASDRIKLIQAWDSSQEPTILDGVTAPVLGYTQDNRVTWTGEEPPTYRAVWSDDPDKVVFEKVPAPQQSETGTDAREAMKKPKQRDYTKGETK